jgi:hypothetical protein
VLVTLNLFCPSLTFVEQGKKSARGMESSWVGSQFARKQLTRVKEANSDEHSSLQECGINNSRNTFNSTSPLGPML